MIGYYVLDGTTPMPCDALTWARWFETANRHVALSEPCEGIAVSTVFLGLDHNFSREGPPLLFETMAFSDVPDLDNHLDDFTRRWSTWQDAAQGHATICVFIQRWVQARRASLWEENCP